LPAVTEQKGAQNLNPFTEQKQDNKWTITEQVSTQIARIFIRKAASVTEIKFCQVLVHFLRSSYN